MRQSLGQQRHAEAIHHDVMVSRVPKEPIIRRLEQGVSKQWSARRLNRPGQIRVHPQFSGGSRVSLGADIDERHGPGRRGANELA